MERPIGLIANPYAGKGLDLFDPILREIQRPAGRERIVYYIPDTLSRLSLALREMVQRHAVPLVMVYGGDGTLHKVVDSLLYDYSTQVISSLPLILPLGGGTMRAVFRWLGWRSKPVDIFQKAMRTPLDKLPIRKMRPLVITYFNEKKQREEKRFGFIFLIGAVSRIIRLYSSQGRSTENALKHLLAGISAGVFGWPRSHGRLIKPFEAAIAADGQAIVQLRTLSAICSVTNSLIFGVKPFRGTAESNQFYAVSYNIPAWLVALLLPIEVRGTYVPANNRFFNQPVFSFTVTPEEENVFCLDGDFFFNQPGKFIDIKLGPEIELISYF